jgi:putative transcriptional regulator
MDAEPRRLRLDPGPGRAPDGASLAGRLLIAMPGTGGMFRRSVVLLCAHGAEGAMGLIVNRAHRDATMAGLLQALDIVPPEGAADAPLREGGPVEPERGFVLHRVGWAERGGTVEVGAGMALTGSRRALEEMAAGAGPDAPLVAMGHAGWAAGQLEGEIARDAWLVAPGDAALVLGRDDAAKWGAALASLGVSPEALAGTGGRA